MVLLSLWSEAFPARKRTTRNVSVRDISFPEEVAGEGAKGKVGKEVTPTNAKSTTTSLDDPNDSEEQRGAKEILLCEDWADSGKAATEAQGKTEDALDRYRKDDAQSSEVAELVRKICSASDLLRVKPTKNDLVAFWGQCQDLVTQEHPLSSQRVKRDVTATAFAKSLAEQLCGEPSGHDYKPQLRALCVIQFLYCEGDLEREVVDIVFTLDVGDILQHLADEVAACRELALRVAEMRKLAKVLPAGDNAQIGVDDEGNLFIIPAAERCEAVESPPGLACRTLNVTPVHKVEPSEPETFKCDDPETQEAGSTEAESVAERKISSAASHASDEGDDVCDSNVCDVDDSVSAAASAPRSSPHWSRDADADPGETPVDSAEQPASPEDGGEHADDVNDNSAEVDVAAEGSTAVDVDDPASVNLHCELPAGAEALSADDAPWDPACASSTVGSSADTTVAESLLDPATSSSTSDATQDLQVSSSAEEMRSGRESVAVWLEELALSRYVDALIGAGYDDLRILKEVEEEEVEEMVGLVGMLPGHARQFKRGLKKLKVTDVQEARVEDPSPMPEWQSQALKALSTGGKSPSLSRDLSLEAVDEFHEAIRSFNAENEVHADADSDRIVREPSPITEVSLDEQVDDAFGADAFAVRSGEYPESTVDVNTANTAFLLADARTEDASITDWVVDDAPEVLAERSSSSIDAGLALSGILPVTPMSPSGRQPIPIDAGLALSGMLMSNKTPADLQDCCLSPGGRISSETAPQVLASRDCGRGYSQSPVTSLHSALAEDPNERLRKQLESMREPTPPPEQIRHVPFIPWGVELTIPKVEEPFAELSDYAESQQMSASYRKQLTI
jgi:hypothetical protein